MKKVVIITLLMLTTISSVYAGESWHTSKIEKIYPLSTGDFVIIFTNPAEGCLHPNGYHYVTINESGVTAEGIRNMLSVALTAGTTGKEITANFENTSATCPINRLIVTF